MLLYAQGPVNPSHRLPNTLSIGLRNIRASDLLSELSETVAASASAACHTGGSHQVSAILQACQVPLEFALGTLRLSVGRHTTSEEVDQAATYIIAAAQRQLAEGTSGGKLQT